MKKAQDEHIKTPRARELRFEDLGQDFSLRAQFSLVCAFYFPFLLALALARRPCLSPLLLSAPQSSVFFERVRALCRRMSSFGGGSRSGRRA